MMETSDTSPSQRRFPRLSVQEVDILQRERWLFPPGSALERHLNPPPPARLGRRLGEVEANAS